MRFSGLLSAIVYLFTQGAHSTPCDVVPETALEINGRAYQVQSPDGGVLTLIGDNIFQKPEIKEALDLITDHTGPPDQVKSQLRKFVDGHKEGFKSYEDDMAYIRRALTSQHPPHYIGVEDARNDFKVDVQAVHELKLNAWVQNHVRNLGPPSDWSHLVLATIGPVLYLKEDNPGLFNNVEIVPLSTVTLKSAQDRKLTPAGGSDAILLVSLSNLHSLTLTMVSLCQKSYKPVPATGAAPPPMATTPAPSPASPAPAVPAPQTELADNSSNGDETPKGRPARVSSSRPYIQKTSRSGVTYGPFSYSWWTTDASGHRWHHVRPLKRHE